MNKEEINWQINLALGWTPESGFMEYDGAKLPWTMWRKGLANKGNDTMPNYYGDLNAMHEAEKVLTIDQQAEMASTVINLKFMLPDDDTDPNSPLIETSLFEEHGWYGLLRASAVQRAEAFLKTIGKWVE